MRNRLFVALVSGLMMASSHAMAASGMVGTDTDTGLSHDTTSVSESPEPHGNVPSMQDPGKFSPWQMGRPLLPHELTHVGQQSPFGFSPWQMGPHSQFFKPFGGCPGWGPCAGPGWFFPVAPHFMPTPHHAPCVPKRPCACSQTFWDHDIEGEVQHAAEQEEDLNDPVLDDDQKKLDKALKEAIVEFYEELYEELYDAKIADKDFAKMFKSMSEDEKKAMFKGFYPFPDFNKPKLPHVPLPHPGPIWGSHGGCFQPCAPICCCPVPCGPTCGPMGMPHSGGPGWGAWGGAGPGWGAWGGAGPGWGAWGGGGHGWGGGGPGWGAWGGGGHGWGAKLLPTPCPFPYPTLNMHGNPLFDQEEAEEEEIQTEDPTTLAV